MEMSELLAAYANMCEAALRDPKRFGTSPLEPAVKERRQRELALLRALSAAEGTALLRDGQLPARLADLAVSVGLTVDQCRGVLQGVAWKLTEGLRVKQTRE